MYKNSLLLTALLACNIAANADETTFTPQQFTLTYTITPVEMTDDVMVLFDQMRSIINDGHNNEPNFYDKLIIFIRDVQTAIQSGMNLVGIVTTTHQPILTTIKEVIEAEQLIDQEINSSTTQETKSDIANHPNELSFSLAIDVNHKEEFQHWTTIKEMLLELQLMLQDKTTSPDTIAQALQAIMKEKKQLKGVITLSASINE